MNYKQVCVVIPAFNEEDSIVNVITEIKKVNNNLGIVVINDASSDNTGSIALKTGVEVINLPFNLGVGGAVQTGLMFAESHDFKYAIHLDADGQHNPKDIPKLLFNLKRANLAVGSRFLKKTKYKTPVDRKLGMLIYSLLIYLTCKFKIYDPTSGFKAFDKKAIKILVKQNSSESSDLLFLPILLKNGCRIVEVPIEMRKRIAGKSSFKTLSSIYLLMSISISILIESVKNTKRSYE